jgi:hypothetical protein
MIHVIMHLTLLFVALIFNLIALANTSMLNKR